MKIDIIKSIIYCILMLLLIGVFFSSAQTKSTNETKVVSFLSQKTNEVFGITLLDTKNHENVLFNKYPNHIFYLGILNGSYESSDSLVQPLSESTITIYTDKMLFSEDHFSLLDHINFGSAKNGIQSRL